MILFWKYSYKKIAIKYTGLFFLLFLLSSFELLIKGDLLNLVQTVCWPSIFKPKFIDTLIYRCCNSIDYWHKGLLFQHVYFIGIQTYSWRLFAVPWFKQYASLKLLFCLFFLRCHITYDITVYAFVESEQLVTVILFLYIPSIA